MERLTLRVNGSLNNRLAIQIALAAGTGPNTDFHIRLIEVRRILIRLRINRHGLNSQILAGFDNAQCYLAAVGDEDAFEKSGGIKRVFLFQ